MTGVLEGIAIASAVVGAVVIVLFFVGHWPGSTGRRNTGLLT